MPKTIVILIPVFNDSRSLNMLLEEMKKAIDEKTGIDFYIQVIDDGSSEVITAPPGFPGKIGILHLPVNIGHQKAIATGLAYTYHHLKYDAVLIMDGDGEDKVTDMLRLADALSDDAPGIVFAARAGRQESFLFKLSYVFYKLLFRLLTGKRIAYGNFMIIPGRALAKLVYYSDIWNHLPAAILKSGLPFTSIPATRGKRYAGSSKMSFNSLLLHGLGAIAVFIEKVASRLLLFSLSLIGLSVAVIVFILCIKWFTNLAIPGWASTILSSMIIVLLQSFLLSLFTVFIFLSSQSNRKFIPAIHYKDFTGETDQAQ